MSVIPAVRERSHLVVLIPWELVPLGFVVSALAEPLVVKLLVVSAVPDLYKTSLY